LIREVDENAYRAVVEPDTVAFAHLVRIAADEAASPDALGAPDRIAGYPIRGSLRTLDKQDARAVSEVFSDWSNYLPERLTRCAFEHLIGFRFTRGRERVDIALTGPCWLAMWTFQRNGRIAEWSSPFHREHAAHLFAAADTL
jgi:hypothetical protein